MMSPKFQHLRSCSLEIRTKAISGTPQSTCASLEMGRRYVYHNLTAPYCKRFFRLESMRDTVNTDSQVGSLDRSSRKLEQEFLGWLRLSEIFAMIPEGTGYVRGLLASLIVRPWDGEDCGLQKVRQCQSDGTQW